MTDPHDTARSTDDAAVSLDERDTHRAAMADRLSTDRAARSSGEANNSLPPDRRTVRWMRISDVVAAGAESLAGRAVNVDAHIVHRIRTTAAVSRRAISERTHQLPPLSAFVRSRQQFTTRHDDLTRS